MGCKSDALSKWLSGSFALAVWTEKMSISIQSGELFALQGAVITNRKTAGQEWEVGAGKGEWSSPPSTSFWFCFSKLRAHRVHVVAGGFQFFPIKIRKLPAETIWKFKHCWQVDSEYLKDRFVKACVYHEMTHCGILSWWATFSQQRQGTENQILKSCIKYFYLT